MNIRYRTIQKLKNLRRAKMSKSRKYRNNSIYIYDFDPILLCVDEEYLNRYNIIGNSSHPTD